MKIALVQINPIIGDFDYNCEKIIKGAVKAMAAGCQLAIFPEMTVSGYPPQDLLERASFIARQNDAVSELVSRLPEIAVLFGCFVERNAKTGKRLYNAAVVASGGKIIFRTYKQLLPAYDVFDETRYFEPGEDSKIFSFEGCNFGVTVCEDIWHQRIADYQKEPVRMLQENARKNSIRLDAIINISASPFQRNKEAVKQKMLADLCREYDTPIIYVNQVGGQDSLLFDGRSVVLDRSGEITAKGPAFAEGSITVSTSDWRGEIKSEKINDEISAIYSGLVMGVRDYVRKCGFANVVLGLSGGIDSALTAAIAVDALGADNVMGVAMPSPYSSSDSEEDARKLAESLGCQFKVLPIENLFEGFKANLAPVFNDLPEDITEQNLQARIRGNLLMALSNKFGSLLLTTGNKSEMAVGYCTLYGDMSGGLAVISDVPKQLVYELARYVNRNGEVIPERTLVKPPTAELKPDQCDQDDLPAYEVLDRILQLYLEEGLGKTEIIAQGIDEKIVKDVLRRIRLNEYKRKQAPMGLKVTSKAFGYGRRYPNVQNFIE